MGSVASKKLMKPNYLIASYDLSTTFSPKFLYFPIPDSTFELFFILCTFTTVWQRLCSYENFPSFDSRSIYFILGVALGFSGSEEL